MKRAAKRLKLIFEHARKGKGATSRVESAGKRAPFPRNLEGFFDARYGVGGPKAVGWTSQPCIRVTIRFL